VLLATANELETKSPKPTMAARIASVMAQWDRIDSPGCAIGMVQNGELTYKRGFGQANLDHGIPITSRTVFDIGSTSKQLAAAAVALLAERNALSLDDDIRKHLPEMPDYGQPITIRHLIHHTSGIRDYLTVMTLAGLTAGVSIDTSRISRERQPRRCDFIAGRSRMGVMHQSPR
jgi:CubicO group peptidase (beta-lactamase class C family)